MKKNKILLYLLTISLFFICTPIQAKNDQSQLSLTLPEFEHIIIDSNGPRSPWAKAIGDLNNDGLKDFIVGGHRTNIPTIPQKILRKLGMWNNDGINGDLVWYQSPTWDKRLISNKHAIRTSVSTADINDDGLNDIIAVADEGLLWLENPGDNPKNAQWQHHVIDSRKFHDVIASDLDQDGDIDLVARNQSLFNHNDGNSVIIFIQEKPNKAAFTPPPLNWSKMQFTVSHGEGLKLSNINNDKFPDIIINEIWLENPGDSSTRGWLKHKYTKTWTWQDVSIETADINNDSRIDIILTPSEKEGQHYRISWFEAPQNLYDQWKEHIIDPQVEAIHHSVQAKDFNKDGRIDILTAEMNQGKNPDEVKIYLNTGKSHNPWKKQVIATTGAHNIQAADIDNDLDIDFFGTQWEFKNHQGNYPVELWKNKTSQKSQSQWIRHIVDDKKPWKSIFIDSKDIDGDQLPDIVTGAWWYKNPGNLKKHWLRYKIGDGANNIAVISDFDRDGDIDILASGWESISSQPPLLTRIKNRLNIKKHDYQTHGEKFVWAKNNGNGDFTIFDNIATAKGDLLQGATSLEIEHSLYIALSWHEPNNGVQMFSVPSAPSKEQWDWKKISHTSQDEQISSGDIDNDGDTDLLLGTQWLDNRSGDWPNHTLYKSENKPDRSLLLDLDKNGRLDAVIGYEAISKPGVIAWYQQQSNRTSPWKQHIIGKAIGPMSLSAVDMDADNDIDIVVGEHNLANPHEAKIMWFENLNAKATSWASHLISKGDEHHNGAIAIDIDNDNDYDIVSIGWGHTNVLLYENLRNN